MAIFRCKMCGGAIEITDGQTTAVCPYCSTQQTLPKLDKEKRVNLYDRANHFRRNNEFDKAAAIYEQILNEDTTDAEAYWSLVLCRYGVEYVEETTNHKRVPTVNRTQFTSIFDDNNYKSALMYADNYQKSIYESEAAIINEIQKGILAISQKEDDFDIFICYKETDENGKRTPDSVLANDLYHQLIAEGFKVFFAKITLEDKLGQEYEPYIFAALQSAKVMVVLGTKKEHFNAVWVKNEWSRYLSLVKASNGKKVLIPAYKDMDPYGLPEEFSHLQAQDMSKLGFMQDLIRGIKKIIQKDEPTVKETVVMGTQTFSSAPLIKRVFLFLEDGEFALADDYCEKVLDHEPENAEAYLGKLMIKLRCKTREELKNLSQPFDSLVDYQKIMRFGGDGIKAEVQGYIDFINSRNIESRYNEAVNIMTVAKTEQQLSSAAAIFSEIINYKDSQDKIEECKMLVFEVRKEDVYQKGMALINADRVDCYQTAIETLTPISDYKDTAEKIDYARYQIDLHKKHLADIEAEKIHQAEKERFTAQEAKRKKIRNKIIAVGSAFMAVLIVILIITVGIPSSKYSDGAKLLEAGDYKGASDIFADLGDYHDSEQRLAESYEKLSMQVFNNTDFTFGAYEQDSNTENGTEPLKWKVLEVQNGKALVISEYCLEAVPFHKTNLGEIVDSLVNSEGVSEINWQNSFIRTYLNEDFYNKAFSDSEKSSIAQSAITTDDSSENGTSTEDKIFLLSVDEAKTYFSSKNERKVMPTEYAKTGKIEVGSKSGTSWWWLRSTGTFPGNASTVGADGIVNKVGHSMVNEKVGIRPAMWIEMK